jgi:thioesterase domain-containing protein
VRRVAARHVTALRSVQAHGPYHLAGHSFGGLVAFEIAHQLCDAGERVALLAILDSFAPDPALIPRPQTPGLPGKLKDLVALAGTGILPTPGHGHYLRFHRQSATLGRRYRGRPWSGRTLVIAAEDAGVPGRAGEWGRFLTGPWQLKSLPGDHEAIVREPYVGAVADAISAALEGIKDQPK